MKNDVSNAANQEIKILERGEKKGFAFPRTGSFSSLLLLSFQERKLDYTANFFKTRKKCPLFWSTKLLPSILVLLARGWKEREKRVEGKIE